LPSLLVNWDGEREPLTGEIRLALRFSKDNPGEFSGSADDIDIARGELEKLELPSILILWPRLERLYELTVAQPEPAAQPEPVEPRTPITPQEAAAPREEPPPAAPPPAAACEEQSPPAHEEAKAPKPAKSTPKRAATPKQKSAKRQTGRVTL